MTGANSILMRRSANDSLRFQPFLASLDLLAWLLCIAAADSAFAVHIVANCSANRNAMIFISSAILIVNGLSNLQDLIGLSG